MPILYTYPLCTYPFSLRPLSLIFFLSLAAHPYSTCWANNELLKDFSSEVLDSSSFPANLKGYANKLNSPALKPKELSSLTSELQDLLKKTTRGHHDELYFLLGLANEKAGQLDKAKRFYTESLKRRANRVSPVVRLGIIAKKNKNFQLAIDHFNEAKWHLSTLNHEILNHLAECFLGLGNAAKANILLTEARALQPSAKPNVELLLESDLKKLQANTDPSESILLETKIFGHLRALIDAGETSPKVLNLFSEYTLKTADPLIDSGEFDRLESLLEKNLKSSNYSEEIVEPLVNTLILRRKLNKASEILAIGLKSDPGSAKLNELKKQLNIELGSS